MKRLVSTILSILGLIVFFGLMSGPISVRHNLLPSPLSTAIIIDGDGGFAGYLGNGTQGNPYRIENLTINGNGTIACIDVSNMNQYFTIWNCTLYNASYGVCLFNTTHGSILNSTMYCNVNGIYLYFTNNSYVANNNIFQNLIGLRFSVSDNNTIIHNYIHNNTNEGVWVEISDRNNITRNRINNNAGTGISLTSSRYNYITYNQLYCNLQGWYEWQPGCWGNVFEGNDVGCGDPTMLYILIGVASAAVVGTVAILAWTRARRENYV